MVFVKRTWEIQPPTNPIVWLVTLMVFSGAGFNMKKRRLRKINMLNEISKIPIILIFFLVLITASYKIVAIWFFGKIT